MKKHASPPLISSSPHEEEDQKNAPAPSFSGEQARALVEQSYTLNMLILTLSHGATFAGRSFAAHTGLMNLMKRAYEEQDAERFLSTLQQYLEQAQGRVAQVPPPRQIEPIMVELGRLVQQCGLPLVARRLLLSQQLV